MIFILFLGIGHQTNQRLSYIYGADTRVKNLTFANMKIAAIVQQITIAFGDTNLNILGDININVLTIIVNTLQYNHLRIKCI